MESKAPSPKVTLPEHPVCPISSLSLSHLSCPASTAHPNQLQTSIASLNSSSGSASSASSTLPGVRSYKRFTKLVLLPLLKGGPTFLNRFQDNGSGPRQPHR